MSTIPPFVTAEEAISIIQSNQRVFVHGGAATQHLLIKKMVERANELWNVEIVSISLQGDIEFAQPIYKENFNINSLFVSAGIRDR